MPDHATKQCSKCGEIKPLGEFTKDRNKRDGHCGRCRDCTQERDRRRWPARREAQLQRLHDYYEANGEALRDYQRRYREANPGKIRERDRRYYEANREELLEKQREWREAHPGLNADRCRRRAGSERSRVFDHYGWTCACPGCYATEDLTIDHINGDGAQHRQELFGTSRGTGTRSFYLWLIRENFPPDFQTLCRGCNISKGRGERCRIDHRLEHDVENDAW